MEPDRREVRHAVFGKGKDQVILSLAEEDYSAVYPGMIRFVLTVTHDDRILARFRTNTYEYTPAESLTAEAVAVRQADAWAEELRKDPRAFSGNDIGEPLSDLPRGKEDLIILQGSPRPDGSCATLAQWASRAAEAEGRSARILYPHDLDIHCCIGCYQCYNTGTCVFDDDMKGIIEAIRGAKLVIVCSPVYTNTVPAGLKLVIDRMQAYHAERMLYGGAMGRQGLLFAVAGRKGEENFTCITKVVRPFLHNTGIVPAGQVLVDHADAIRDIRTVAGLGDRVREMVVKALGGM